jgi:hypothetical protein
MPKGEQSIKLYRRVGKKRYLKGKHAYEYERIFVPVPSKFHNQIKPLLDHKVKMTLTQNSDAITITLQPRKNNSARRKHPAKTQA